MGCVSIFNKETVKLNTFIVERLTLHLNVKLNTFIVEILTSTTFNCKVEHIYCRKINIP